MIDRRRRPIGRRAPRNTLTHRRLRMIQDDAESCLRELRGHRIRPDFAKYLRKETKTLLERTRSLKFNIMGCRDNWRDQ